jgi:hypothetical protein
LNNAGVLLAKLQADLKELIELLSSHSVDYLIVVGHAVAFHDPRFTGDIGWRGDWGHTFVFQPPPRPLYAS